MARIRNQATRNAARKPRTGDGVFRRTFRNSSGELLETDSFYFDFRDHRNIEHRLLATTNRAASVELKRKIKELVAYRIAGMPLDERLSNFLETYRFRDRLAEWDIIPKAWASTDKSIFEHIDDYARTIGTSAHAKEVKGKLYRIALDNGWKIIGDITADGYAEWRDARHTGADRLNAPQAADSGRTNKRDGSKNKRVQLSPRTLQHFTIRVKAFTSWLPKKGLLYADPLEKMDLKKITFKKVYVRIPFKPSEVERIIAAAVASDGKVEGMTGFERALFYQLVYGTGLRYTEGKMLKREYFFLDAEVPHVFIPEGDDVTKNGKTAYLPLTAELVMALRSHLKNVPAGGRIFSGGLRDGKGAKMLRVDMESAGIKDVDELGRHRDFHGFRHSFATVLCISGVSLAMAQKMMRHSDPNLTTAFYMHAELEDMARELEKIPKVNVDIWAEMLERSEEATAAPAE